MWLGATTGAAECLRFWVRSTGCGISSCAIGDTRVFSFVLP